MNDTWYRGEAVNVPMSMPGTVVHDIGDGMYLTDDMKVAQQYAGERAVMLADRRVYRVRLAQGMKVLDLTIDPRWRKMMDFPMDPTGKTPETFEMMLRRQPASQQYRAAFDQFVKVNKIDLNTYDAVIGYEYRSGGKQMVILYKNGVASPAQLKLRTMFIPVGPGALPRSPNGWLRFSGRIGPGMKIAGGTLAAVLASALSMWFIGKQQEDSIKRQIEELKPQIEDDIRKNKASALRLAAEGKKAFATARIQISNQDWLDPGLGYMPTASSVKYLGMTITENDQTTPAGKDDGNETKSVSLGAMVNRTFYKMSFGLEFSDEEIELYRNYLKEIQWYESQAGFARSPEEVRSLSLQRNDLILQLREALGAH